MRKLKVKGDDEYHGEDSPDGGNKKDHEHEQPAQPGDSPEAGESIEKRGGDGLPVGHDGLYTFPLDGVAPSHFSHASDASTSVPPPPVYQTHASVSSLSGSSVVTASAEPLTLDSAILPPADASLRRTGCFSSDFPLPDMSMDLDVFADITPYSADSAAYGVPQSFTGGPGGGMTFSQAMDEAIQEFNAFNQLSSNSDSTPVTVSSNSSGLEWTFLDQTNPTIPLATVPLAITPPTHCVPDTGSANATDALPVAKTHHLPIPSAVDGLDTQPLKQKKRKTTPRKRNSESPPVPGESNPLSANTGENTPTLQSSPPPADTAAKRVRKKSTRNELANAIGTNMPTFQVVGKENIPPEDRESESLAGRKRKQMETNGSPNKRYVLVCVLAMIFLT